MKKLFILLALSCALCLSSCDGRFKYEYYGTEETADKIANFVSSNIKSANNMSDEEMEDVISELYKTAVKNFCVLKARPDKLPNERVFAY